MKTSAFTKLDQCTQKEIARVVRVSTAIIAGLSRKGVTLKEVKQFLSDGDSLAALSLGLTVHSAGAGQSHDLDSLPVTGLIASNVKRTIADTVSSLKKMRGEAEQILSRTA